jgi:hypothetical protein
MLMLGLDLPCEVSRTSPLPAAVAAVMAVLVLELELLVPLVGRVYLLSRGGPRADVRWQPLLLLLLLLLLERWTEERPLAIHRRPASCSLSLRFSLRACDFEYGARDASKPVVRVVPPKIHSFPRNFFFRPQ